MNRKDAFYRLSLLMGASIIVPQWFFRACNQHDNELVENNQEIDLFNEIADLILPATDTPGAKEANAGKFIQECIVNCYTSQDQKTFSEGKADFDRLLAKEYGVEFSALPADKKFNVIARIDAEMSNKKTPLHYFYRILKELTILGYFTSEQGCTQALRYIETPGRYVGDVPYQKGEKAWATR